VLFFFGIFSRSTLQSEWRWVKHWAAGLRPTLTASLTSSSTTSASPCQRQSAAGSGCRSKLFMRISVRLAPAPHSDPPLRAGISCFLCGGVLLPRFCYGASHSAGEGLQPQYTKPGQKKNRMNVGGSVNVCAGLSGGKVVLWEYLPKKWNGEEAAKLYNGAIAKCLRRQGGVWPGLTEDPVPSVGLVTSWAGWVGCRPVGWICYAHAQHAVRKSQLLSFSAKPCLVSSTFHHCFASQAWWRQAEVQGLGG
jgi:hypothetical protein